MNVRTNTTYELDAETPLIVTPLSDYGMVAFHTYGEVGFTLHLRPAHLPALRILVSALEAFDQRKTEAA